MQLEVPAFFASNGEEVYPPDPFSAPVLSLQSPDEPVPEAYEATPRR